MDERSRHRQFEDRFLGQLRARSLVLTRGRLPADEVSIEPTSEGTDAVRAELGRLERWDRDILDQLPGTSSFQFRFDKRLFGGLVSSTVARVRVRVLAPAEAMLDNRDPGPVGREEVLDALARYKLLPRKQRPTGVVLASATGFTPEAKRLAESIVDLSLVLVGGREDGGWDVTLPRRLAGTSWAKLFELETPDERLGRLLHHLRQESERLDSRGVPLDDLADKLGLSELITERLVRQACRQDPRLMTVVHDGTIHICRTPLADEGDSMTIWSRIRKLLGFKPTVAEQVRELTAKRVRIEQQRSELDRRVNTLEADERDLLQKGAAAKSGAERKQLAGKLMRARRDLGRLRAQTQVFTQQIDVIGTHIHHLTLAEHGRRVALPKAEELTARAAEAEKVMSELAANAELATGIEVTGETPMMAEEEAAILAEFDEVAQASAPPAAAGEQAEPEREAGPPAAEGTPAAQEERERERPRPAAREKPSESPQREMG